MTVSHLPRIRLRSYGGSGDWMLLSLCPDVITTRDLPADMEKPKPPYWTVTFHRHLQDAEGAREGLLETGCGRYCTRGKYDCLAHVVIHEAELVEYGLAGAGVALPTALCEMADEALGE